MKAATAEEAALIESKRKRAAELKAIRETEKQALKKTGQANTQDRLAYLMKQSDIFQHFMSGNRPGADGAASTDAGAADAPPPPPPAAPQDAAAMGIDMRHSAEAGTAPKAPPWRLCRTPRSRALQ